jgi:sirohydrochlorin cobaltochelatase
LACLLQAELQAPSVQSHCRAGVSEQRSSPSSTQRFVSPPLIGTAALELAPLPLHQQIQQFAQQVLASRQDDEQLAALSLEICPLFLLPGVHVAEDIPAEVAIAQQNLGNQIKLNLRPYLGSYPTLWQLLHQSLEALSTPTKILLSHGSSRPESADLIESIAASVGALPAYWSISPSLEDRVTSLVQGGTQHIAIFPYFLFSGGITDAIAQTVEQLSQRFPTARLHLATPIGASADLAKVIVENI